MSTSLSELEAHRNGLLQQFTALGDMRRGSVSAFRRRCGRPNDARRNGRWPSFIIQQCVAAS